LHNNKEKKKGIWKKLMHFIFDNLECKYPNDNAYSREKIAKSMELEWLFYECVANYVLKNLFSSTQKLFLMEETRNMCIWTKCNKDKKCCTKCMHQQNTTQKNNWLNTKIGEEEDCSSWFSDVYIRERKHMCQ
jgi:hypothetical protein